MNYTIVIENRAKKEAENIPRKFRDSIDKTIQSLRLDPRPKNAIKLTDKNGYRVRVGNYRILYSIDDEAKIVAVYRIKIRGESTYK